VGLGGVAVVRLSRNLILSAGVILIAAGIALLVWSHVLADSTADAWWIGTLQALGVGFLVGGLVDVLAISGLERVTKAEDRKQERYRNEANARAQDILTTIPSEASQAAAWDLVRSESYLLLDEWTREKVLNCVWSPTPSEVRNNERAWENMMQKFHAPEQRPVIIPEEDEDHRP
jgi:hypothetical protein